MDILQDYQRARPIMPYDVCHLPKSVAPGGGLILRVVVVPGAGGYFGAMLPLDFLPTTLGMFGTTEGTELAGPGTSDATLAVPVIVTSRKM